MDLTNFLNVLAKCSHDFSSEWMKCQEEQPEHYPVELELQDWFDQFSAYLDMVKFRTNDEV